MSLPTDDKARKALPLWTFLIEYFPDAFLAVANVAIQGNIQHNPGEPLHWDRSKSMDQMNTAFRHTWDYGRGVKRDTDGQYHLAKAVWRLSAQLQLDIEADENGQPIQVPDLAALMDEEADRSTDGPSDSSCDDPPYPDRARLFRKS